MTKSGHVLAVPQVPASILCSETSASARVLGRDGVEAVACGAKTPVLLHRSPLRRRDAGFRLSRRRFVNRGLVCCVFLLPPETNAPPLRGLVPGINLPQPGWVVALGAGLLVTVTICRCLGRSLRRQPRFTDNKTQPILAADAATTQAAAKSDGWQPTCRRK